MKKIILQVVFCVFSFSVFAQKIHSHNDYVRGRPFWEAFEAGAESIEVDVFLEEGKLLVAHDKSEIKPENTIERLYLEPLQNILKLRKRQNLQILIDLKTPAIPTLNRLQEVFINYPQLINAHKKRKGKITFVISGNKPLASDYSKYPDFIYFDHQSLDDISAAPKNKIALVSFPFYKYSTWNGKSELTENDQNKLVETIDKVHQFGFPIRFWATPDTPLAWEILNKLQIDYINTDLPETCVKFFTKE